jgi:hypothetical protein
MRHGQQYGTRDCARDALSVSEIARRVGAARPSVTERYRPGYCGPNVNWEHERRSARETPVQVRNAATWRRLPIVLNASAQRWPSGSNDLRDGALQVVRTNTVNPLKRAEKSVAGGGHVHRRDADDGASGHHEHHGEIGERWNSAARDLPDASIGGAIGGRDLRSRSNLLVHGATLGL